MPTPCVWKSPERMVRATEHIPEMVSAIETLRDKGLHVRERRFGLLPNREVSRHTESCRISISSGMRAGARVDVDEYDKADARDFVLWKARKDNESFWDTPIGDGTPGLAH